MKKFVFGILFMSLMVFALVACSSDETPAPAGDNRPAANDPAPAANDPAPAPDEERVITFLLTHPIEREGIWSSLDMFTQETGIVVDVINVPLGESRTQIPIWALGGELPDVLNIDNTDTFNWAQMGFIADLTDLVERDVELGYFFDSVLENQLFNDRFYSMPFYANNLAMYYNREIFDAVGVDVPRTLDEVLEIAPAISAAGYSVFGIAAGSTTDTTFQQWPFIWGSGADWTNLNSPGNIGQLTFFQTLVQNGWMSAEVTTYNAGDNANQFAAGHVAMIVDGPWRLPMIIDNASFEWGVTMIPEGAAGHSTVLGGHNLAISNTANRELAWELVMFFNRPDIMLRFCEIDNYVPARWDVAEASEILNTHPMGGFVGMMDYAIPMPKENYMDISDAIIRMLQSVLLGQASPEDAAAEAAATIAAIN
ncbi:MAG: extracellular solute-binding protein [Defluviitaleaceae bacterium]|nr:extracellular solute-binding protein [Defluviitaleaceae bacterium]